MRWKADIFSLGRQARRRRVDDAAIQQQRGRGSRTGSLCDNKYIETMSLWRPLPEIWHLTEPASASARFWTWVPLKDLIQDLDHGYHPATRIGHFQSNLKSAVVRATEQTSRGE